MPEERNKPRYTIDCHDVVHVLEFSPYEWSCNILAVGTATRVSTVSCRFEEDNPEVEGLEQEHIRDFHHGCRVTAIAWSPQTSLLTVPRVLKFCTGGGDNKVRLFCSDLKEEDTVNVVGEHRDYVNAVAFQPSDTGDHLASTSDDLTCRVWSTDGAPVACFPLGSPGMSLCWHTEQSDKLMVAEKKGIIRFYSFLTQQPLMSLDCGCAPLSSADWCHGNALLVAAMAGSDWLVFDTSRSSRPLENKCVHPEGGKVVQWSRSHDFLLASIGRPHSQVKVYNVKTNQVVLSTELVISNGMSWHHRLPLVAIGGDKAVKLFWVEPV